MQRNRKLHLRRELKDFSGTQVKRKYLSEVNNRYQMGSTIHDEENREKEIVKRIGLAEKAFGTKDGILRNLSMSMKVE